MVDSHNLDRWLSHTDQVIVVVVIYLLLGTVDAQSRIERIHFLQGHFRLEPGTK